jgi:hypothetical protein
MGDTVSDKINGLTIQHVTLADKTCRLTINNETVKFNTQELAEKLIADSEKLETYRQKSEQYDYQKSYSIPADSISLTGETPHFEIKFEVTDMNFRLLKNKKPEVTSVTFMYLIKQK